MGLSFYSVKDDCGLSPVNLNSFARVKGQGYKDLGLLLPEFSNGAARLTFRTLEEGKQLVIKWK
jgi:hypothetical protein